MSNHIYKVGDKIRTTKFYDDGTEMTLVGTLGSGYSSNYYVSKLLPDKASYPQDSWTVELLEPAPTPLMKEPTIIGTVVRYEIPNSRVGHHFSELISFGNGALWHGDGGLMNWERVLRYSKVEIIYIPKEGAV